MILTKNKIVLSKNKLCDAVDYIDKLKNNIEREKQINFKTETMQNVQQYNIKIWEESLQKIQQAINDYSNIYPKETCSFNCNCPLAKTFKEV